MTIINFILRKVYNLYIQSKVTNNNVTLISSNCNGGCILSDLHLRFNAPFVNLWMYPKDFLSFCENMDYYLDVDMEFVNEPGIEYPVGKIDDIKLYFQHYNTEEEAKYLWNKRKSRINRNAIYLLFTDRDGCTYDDLIRFERLKYKKIAFCNKEYPELKSAYYIPGFEDGECVGNCMDFLNGFTYKKYYDAFDYVSWINGTN